MKYEPSLKKLNSIIFVLVVKNKLFLTSQYLLSSSASPSSSFSLWQSKSTKTFFTSGLFVHAIYCRRVPKANKHLHLCILPLCWKSLIDLLLYSLQLASNYHLTVYIFNPTWMLEGATHLSFSYWWWQWHLLISIDFIALEIKQLHMHR